jgi:hypothetical protein
MHWTCVHPEGAWCHIGIFDALSMNQKESATTVAHKHALPLFHLATGIHTGSISQTCLTYSEYSRSTESNLLTLFAHNGQGFFEFHRIVGLDQYPSNSSL